MDSGIKRIYDRMRRVDERMQAPEELSRKVSKAVIESMAFFALGRFKFEGGMDVVDGALKPEQVMQGDLGQYDPRDIGSKGFRGFEKQTDNVQVSIGDFGEYEEHLMDAIQAMDKGDEVADEITVVSDFTSQSDNVRGRYVRSKTKLIIYVSEIAYQATTTSFIPALLTNGEDFPRSSMATQFETIWETVKSEVRSTVRHELVHYVDDRTKEIFGDPNVDGIKTKKDVEDLSAVPHDLRQGEFWPEIESFLTRIKEEAERFGPIPRLAFKVWVNAVDGDRYPVPSDRWPDRDPGTMVYSQRDTWDFFRKLKEGDPVKEWYGTAEEAWRKAVRVVTKVAENEGWLEQSERDLPEQDMRTVIDRVRN